MLINLYLILSVIFSGIGLPQTSIYFDNLTKRDFANYQKEESPALTIFKVSEIYPWGLEGTEIEPSARAESALAVDIDNRQILFAYNEKKSLPMASLTKMMTAIVALENLPNLDAVVTVSRNAALVEGSKMHLWIDEKITLKDLLYGLILKSGNDAAVAIEEYHDSIKKPQEKAFIEKMNDKAKTLGLKNTQFFDSSGIVENKSTALELSIILDYALRNKTFTQIASTVQYNTKALNGSLEHNMTTTNRLLRTRADTIAGKTGYSEAADYNFINAFRSPQNHRVVVVILGASDHDSRFDECNKIIDWVYSAYQW
ncbi:MAG: D-alanyl-D-alanine carboxypeptidase [Candidatus Berkelbacteria bacterium Licking1014_96]|uniref:D-alanyl-D-alanine carboxypeptidase n=1 Tax=Candidatus Berkelbacteria bacterium Licking1014_96 TaxID=2017149 RepID=A0A554LG24_9BACT|nr:MAG: D-alanyl-D-alanine carboxypeptidase [Candidatus Berkelbacteria bacterium Licking1014_96]